MSTPDYVLVEKYEYYSPHTKEPMSLDAGTFVRPVHWDYLPKDVQQLWEIGPMDKNNDLICYTSKGFVLIPRKLIRRCE